MAKDGAEQLHQRTRQCKSESEASCSGLSDRRGQSKVYVGKAKRKSEEEENYEMARRRSGGGGSSPASTTQADVKLGFVSAETNSRFKPASERKSVKPIVTVAKKDRRRKGGRASRDGRLDEWEIS